MGTRGLAGSQGARCRIGIRPGEVLWYCALAGMLFNSLDFAVFFPIVYALYLVLPYRWQNRMLLVASYVFYGWWDWRFLYLLIASTVVDYYVGHALHNATTLERRRKIMTVSLVVNLGVLALFKYYNFFADTLITSASWFGLELDWITLNILLPVGISFYTFQSLSYTIDIYRKKLTPAKTFWDYALFVAFFPQLVAGPIERATNLLGQVENPRKIEFTQVRRGLFLILLGLFKKVAIADGVAPAVNSVFAEGWAVSGFEVFVGSFLFGVQIYGDFSGYSDIARGTAKLMGFNLMKNFHTPFFSTSPSEYWTRWHISLSSWVRDYLYYSLGLHYMRKGGSRWNRVYKAQLYAMVLMGLWHGASWTFVSWGLFMGLLLIGWALRPKWLKDIMERGPKWTAHLWFLPFMTYSMLLFRANDLGQIGRFTLAFVTNPIGYSGNMVNPTFAAAATLPVLAVLEWFAWRASSEKFYQTWPRPVRAALCAYLIFGVFLGTANGPAQFIYFQF